MLLLFRGDLQGLRRRYALDFQTGESWVLSLEPKQALVRRLLERIQLRGRGERLDEMLVREGGGDLVRTRFANVEPRHRFSDAELDAVFLPAR